MMIRPSGVLAIPLVTVRSVLRRRGRARRRPGRYAGTVPRPPGGPGPVPRIPSPNFEIPAMAPWHCHGM
eukprot:526973-Hanusia_phi.AAC.2